MLPHPQHSDDALNQMVSYIYSLQAGQVGLGLTRALTGESTAPADPEISSATFDASFTDAGRGSVPPIVGQAQVQLRSRRLEAEGAAAIQGAAILRFGHASGKKGLGSIGHGHQLTFRDLPLDQARTVTCRAAGAGSGGTIEIHQDTAAGKLLASVVIAPTGDWDKWEETTVALPPGLGRGDVCLVFVKPGVDGGMMNLDWVRFGE